MRRLGPITAAIVAWTLAPLALLVGCEPGAPPPPSAAPEGPRASRPPPHAHPGTGVAAPTPPPSVVAPPPAAASPLPPRPADPLPAPVSRAAALSPARAMAIAGGALYRLRGDHWQRVGLENAEPRDVVAVRGALWVLAKGSGPWVGRALVLRSASDEELAAVAAPELGADSDPRALIVVREGEYYIGGDAPALARIVGRDVTPIELPDPHVTALRIIQTEMVLALHSGPRVTAWRYGASSSVDEEDFLDEIADPDGTGYIVHGHGEVVRGRPGHEVVAITPAAPFVPRAAAMLPGTRPVVAGEGALAVFQNGEWHAVRDAALPADPAVVIPTQPLLVVGRDGRVAAVDGASVRRLVPGN